MATTNDIKRLHIGTVYYPEQWPESRWEEDAGLMERAGITTVRLAEFAWHKFEPVEGRYEFAWLERALEVLGRHNLQAILCTPTATYPAWLHRKFPDIHQVKSNGQIKEFGQRQDACKNHSGYRGHALKISEAVTKHFGRHPRVIAWQTDNELGCHGTTRCYCEHCERAFQAWLSRRFNDDIGRLNEAWGTAFWSQQYNDFSEISLPRDTADRVGTAGQNPGLSLDFSRFSSDVQVSFNRELVSIIRANSPSRLVTHNLMGFFTDINYFHLARDLDVVSWDNYPFFQLETAHRPPCPLPHDLMRGLKGQNVWVMEQASGPGGWDRILPTPEPGRMRIWAYQALAHGADYISFFRWRTARFGIEQFWHGILPHHGKKGPRYAELTQLASEVKGLSLDLAESRVPVDVAIVFDYDSLWALEIQPHSPSGISYFEVVKDYTTALMRLGVTADIIAPDQEFNAYKMLVVPSQYVADTGFPSKLHEYVRAGGVAVVGARSGVKNEENAVQEEELPAGLQGIVGCAVIDYDTFSFLESEPVEVIGTDGAHIPALHLAELLMPKTGAEPILKYAGRYYSGAVAAVHNPLGRGAAYYLGTYLGSDGQQVFLQHVLNRASIPIIDDLDPAVEVCVRRTQEATYRFYLNHDTSRKSVRLLRGGRDILTRTAVHETLILEALGVSVVRED